MDDHTSVDDANSAECLDDVLHTRREPVQVTTDTVDTIATFDDRTFKTKRRGTEDADSIRRILPGFIRSLSKTAMSE